MHASKNKNARGNKNSDINCCNDTNSNDRCCHQYNGARTIVRNSDSDDSSVN